MEQNCQPNLISPPRFQFPKLQLRLLWKAKWRNTVLFGNGECQDRDEKTVKWCIVVKFLLHLIIVIMHVTTNLINTYALQQSKDSSISIDLLETVSFTCNDASKKKQCQSCWLANGGCGYPVFSFPKQACQKWEEA